MCTGMANLTRRRRRRSLPSGPKRPVAPAFPFETRVTVLIVFLRSYRLAPKSGSALIARWVLAAQGTPQAFVKNLISPHHTTRRQVSSRGRFI
jgi:hypothetical protein